MAADVSREHFLVQMFRGRCRSDAAGENRDGQSSDLICGVLFLVQNAIHQKRCAGLLKINCLMWQMKLSGPDYLYEIWGKCSTFTLIKH